MFTKLLEKGKGKMKCKMHVVQVCLRLAGAYNWVWGAICAKNIHR